MKKIIALILTALILTMTAAAAADAYQIAAVVTGIDYAEDTVTCVGSDGNEWMFYEIENVTICDFLILTLWDAESAEIVEDDEIVDVTMVIHLTPEMACEWLTR